jgi:uncharacterized membrane protein YeaQ/YmgE (transglycosylase-associated protein family)
VELVVGLVIQGLIIGALARLALPGPDPMSWWLTLLVGLVGALVGGSIGYMLGGAAGYFLGAVIFAALLIYLYRRLVQKRPITGPDAHRNPFRRR